jgi:antitoxin ParD1/3/4
MPTRNISLTPKQDAFIAKAVKAGDYQNASEAVRDALRALHQRQREDALKLAALRAAVAAGVEALDQGDFTVVEERDVERHLGRLTMAPRKRAR